MLAAEAGDVDLMKELKKTLSHKNSEQAVPECLEGKVTHDTILDRFRECYEDLYNSAGTEEAMDVIKEKLKEIISEHSNTEVGEIT